MASTLRFRTGPTKQDTRMLESKRQIRVVASIWQVETSAWSEWQAQGHGDKTLFKNRYLGNAVALY